MLPPHDYPRLIAEWLPLIHGVLAYMVVPLIVIIRSHSVQLHDLKIEYAVLRAQHEALRSEHSKTNAELQAMFTTLLTKLNSIEEYLRR